MKNQIVIRFDNIFTKYVFYLDSFCNKLVSVFSSVNSLPGCQAFSIQISDNTVHGVNLQPLGNY